MPDQPANILPQGFECPECAYELARSPVWKCSECGRPIVPSDVAKHHERAGLRGRLPGMLLAHGALYVCIAAIMAAGAAALSNAMLWAGIEAFAACMAALGGSMFLGYVSSRMDRRRDRDALFDAWLRSHLWLNGPWLCIPGCALIMVVPTALDRMGGASMLVGIGGLFVWLIWLPLCVIWWQRRWNRRLGALGVPRKRRHPMVWIAAMLTLVGAAVLGFVGGVVAFTGVLRLFGGGSPFVDG